MPAKCDLSVGGENSMQICSYFLLLFPLQARLCLVTLTRIWYMSKMLMVSSCGYI